MPCGKCGTPVYGYVPLCDMCINSQKTNMSEKRVNKASVSSTYDTITLSRAELEGMKIDPQPYEWWDYGYNAAIDTLLEKMK